MSTGIYRFPKEKAAKIALHTISNLKEDIIKKVIFVCFDHDNYELYQMMMIKK
ncbi:hypothetical protein [Aquimarina sp. AU474]|uniref:hypothetical protein n=1 Tax=Aquimarina sp. AU474 TaxID=2108529 RepID=UPI00351A5560